MWTAEYTIITDASREAIWETWADVENWPKWDKGVEWCRMSGEFKTGNTYTLKPFGAGEVQAIITDCQPLKRFADVSTLPFAKLEFVHELHEHPDGLHVTHRINISGVLSFLFAQVIGKSTQKEFPTTLNNLVQCAKGLT
ncbi:MAG: SRPBCC family protein [Chloroflexi bacterium]|nr:SRPBCC family protein [Chloroflexota bacterium]MBP8058363.1 SRPBCC family protein [Chloroflexota bacterium]